jgi:hypothetical protein
MQDGSPPDEAFSQAEGPSPSDDDADAGEAMEDLISDMDRPLGAEDHTTAEEQGDGDTIDDRTRREQPQRVRRRDRVELTDEADGEGVDAEAEMVGSQADQFGPESPEQAAMHVVDEAPGGVDHPDDYVIGD